MDLDEVTQFLSIFGAPIFLILVTLPVLIFDRRRHVSNKFLAVCGALFALSFYFVFFSNRTNEDVRNMIGFMALSSIFPSGLLAWFSIRSKLQLRRNLVAGYMAGFAIVGYLAWFVAAVAETSTSFTFTLLRIPTAKSLDGKRVSEIVKADAASWTTGGHFYHPCGHDDLVAIKLMLRGSEIEYYFAYDSRAHLLVPLCNQAATAFPPLMPSDDSLINLAELHRLSKTGYTAASEYGGVQLKLPEKWFYSKANSTSPGK